MHDMVLFINCFYKNDNAHYNNKHHLSTHFEDPNLEQGFYQCIKD